MFIILSFGIVKTEDILSICIPKLRISFPHYEERYYIDSKKQIDYVLSFFERKQVLK